MDRSSENLDRKKLIPYLCVGIHCIIWFIIYIIHGLKPEAKSLMFSYL